LNVVGELEDICKEEFILEEASSQKPFEEIVYEEPFLYLVLTDHVSLDPLDLILGSSIPFVQNMPFLETLNVTIVSLWAIWTTCLTCLRGMWLIQFGP